MRIAGHELHVEQLLRRALARDGQHRIRGIDRRDPSAASRQQERGAAGAGADIEHLALVNPADHVCQHARLRGGNQLPDRSAEAAVVERSRRVRVGVVCVAVVIARGLFPRPPVRHARSFTTATGGGVGISASQA